VNDADCNRLILQRVCLCSGLPLIVIPSAYLMAQRLDREAGWIGDTPTRWPPVPIQYPLTIPFVN
jgi:hypothetical protein